MNQNISNFSFSLFCVIFLLYILKSDPIIAQQSSKRNQQAIDAVIEYLSNKFDEEKDFTEIYDDLNYYLYNPLNINNVSNEELIKLHFLNDYQIKSLQDYIKKNGYFQSIYELQLVYGFNKELAKMASLFFTTKTPNKKNKKTKKIYFRNNNQIIIRQTQVLETQKGYNNPDSSSTNYYRGSPGKVYTRYKFNSRNNLFWGITAEKDAGEDFFTGSNKRGFDFYSGHFQLKDKDLLDNLIIGDYIVQIGQGVNIWQGLNFNKSSDVINIKKNNIPFKRYTSTDENNFMRGIAATFNYKNLYFSSFYSQKNIDANISFRDSITNEVLEVSSLLNTGSHAINSEIEDEDAIEEKIFGMHLSIVRKNWKIAATYLNYHYQATIQPRLISSNIYNFKGNQNSNYSIDYQYNLKNISLFGESSICENKSKAFLNGLIAYLNPHITLSLLHRHYDINYQAYYSSCFSENSRTVNENGLYLGAEILPFKYWKLSIFFDRFNFPWMTYNVNAPSKGYHCVAQINYVPSEHLTMYWKLSHKNKPDEIHSDSTKTAVISETKKTNLRYHITYSPVKDVILKNRLEISNFSTPGIINENGYLIYQEVEYKPSNIPLSISLRYSMFDIDSYNTRIYTYERDVLYAFSIPSFFDKGTRIYLNVNYRISKFLKLWGKFSQTQYDHKSIIRSGLNEIEGNKISEIKFQLQVDF